MAHITNDLLYEVVKAMQSRLDGMDGRLGDVTSELQAIRTHLTGVGQDISTIYQVMDRQGQRLERIETRLNLAEPAH